MSATTIRGRGRIGAQSRDARRRRRLSGDETLYIADGTWKWAPQGNTKDAASRCAANICSTGAMASSIRRSRHRRRFPTSSRSLRLRSPNLGRASAAALIRSRLPHQSHVDTGYRYDKLWTAGSGPYASAFDPQRHSVMLNLAQQRVQPVAPANSHDDLNANQTDNALYLQYQVSLGAHARTSFDRPRERRAFYST